MLDITRDCGDCGDCGDYKASAELGFEDFLETIHKTKDGEFQIWAYDQAGGYFDVAMTKEQLVELANKLLEFAEKA